MENAKQCFCTKFMERPFYFKAQNSFAFPHQSTRQVPQFSIDFSIGIAVLSGNMMFGVSQWVLYY